MKNVWLISERYASSFCHTHAEEASFYDALSQFDATKGAMQSSTQEHEQPARLSPEGWTLTLSRSLRRRAQTVGSVAGPAMVKTVKTADAFARSAAIGDLFEIQVANLVLDRAPSPAIRTVAQRMLEDHTHTVQTSCR